MKASRKTAKTAKASEAKRAERPKPCPCCGNKKLYIGAIEFAVKGVQCERHVGGCGLQLGRRYPHEMPKFIWKKFRGQSQGDQAMRALGVYTLKQAIKAWNRRKTV